MSVYALPSVDHLYELSLLVADQSEGERQKSLREGLEKIVVRISGQTDFRENAVIREAFSNPDAYLQQFGYISLSEVEKAELRTATDIKNRMESKAGAMNKLRPSLPPTIRINLIFSPESIKSLLRRARLPIWPTNRPSVLVWIVMEGAAGKRLLSQSDPAQGFLLREAGQRGLPIVLPMNDLKDQVILGVNRLWDMDQAAITEASQRYGEDSVLVGRVSQTAGQWQGSWLYLLRGQSWLIESSGDDLEAFLAQGVGEVVKIQLQRYGISPDSSPGTVFLAISGVDSTQDYANTLFFLKNLDPVKSLRVTGANGNILHCALEIDGDGRTIRELIALGRVLVSEDEAIVDQAADVATPVTLHYRLSAE